MAFKTLGRSVEAKHVDGVDCVYGIGGVALVASMALVEEETWW